MSSSQTFFFICVPIPNSERNGDFLSVGDDDGENKDHKDHNNNKTTTTKTKQKIFVVDDF